MSRSEVYPEPSEYGTAIMESSDGSTVIFAGKEEAEAYSAALPDNAGITVCYTPEGDFIPFFRYDYDRFVLVRSAFGAEGKVIPEYSFSVGPDGTVEFYAEYYAVKAVRAPSGRSFGYAVIYPGGISVELFAEPEEAVLGFIKSEGGLHPVSVPTAAAELAELLGCDTCADRRVPGPNDMIVTGIDGKNPTPLISAEGIRRVYSVSSFGVPDPNGPARVSIVGGEYVLGMLKYGVVRKEKVIITEDARIYVTVGYIPSVTSDNGTFPYVILPEARTIGPLMISTASSPELYGISTSEAAFLPMRERERPIYPDTPIGKAYADLAGDVIADFGGRFVTAVLGPAGKEMAESVAKAAVEKAVSRGLEFRPKFQPTFDKENNFIVRVVLPPADGNLREDEKEAAMTAATELAGNFLCVVPIYYRCNICGRTYVNILDWDLFRELDRSGLEEEAPVCCGSVPSIGIYGVGSGPLSEYIPIGDRGAVYLNRRAYHDSLAAFGRKKVPGKNGGVKVPPS